MSRLVATVARAPASRLEPRRRAVAPSPGSTSPAGGFHVVVDVGPSRPRRPPPRSSRRSVGAARGRCGRTPTTATASMREDSFDLGSYDPEMDGYEPPEVSVEDVVKGARIGEGSFAVVFAGTVAGVGDVVLKQYRRDVRGRDWFSFYADERAMCRRLRDRPGVAPFVGVAGSDVYLVWRDVGKRTLANVMEEGARSGGDVLHDALTLAASEMGLTTASEGGLTDSEVFVAVARGLIEAVVSINDADVVHRDVKPDNVLLTSPEKGSPGGARVLMVDLGGAADHETGLGTDASEAIFDPTYGAPEQFKRVKNRSRRGVAGMFAGFGTNRDVDVCGMVGDLEATGTAPTAAFDAFGVGLTLLRLATPALHTATSMKLARSAMDEAADAVFREGKGDEVSVLDEWASGPGSGSCDFGLLDALGAWSLLEGLTQWDPDRRMTLKEALRHPSLN